MLAKSRACVSSGRDSKPHPEGSSGLGNVHPSISQSPSRLSCSVEALTPTPEEASAPECPRTWLRVTMVQADPRPTQGLFFEGI